MVKSESESEPGDKVVEKSEMTSPHVLSVATTIAPLNLKESNMCVTWKSWKSQFKIFMRASNLEQQTEQRKVALLLHHLGPDCLQIFNSFDVDMDVVKYDDLLAKLDGYFVPKVNIAMERHTFFSRKQSQNESIEDYVTVLKNQSLLCEFGDLREDLVKDIFVCGLLPIYSQIKERLLSESKLKLDKALEIAKNINSAKENTSQLQQEINFVGALNKNNKYRQNSSNQRQTSYSLEQHQTKTKYKPSNSQQQLQCSRCGQQHRKKCPAENVSCHLCSNRGHYAKMCFSKSPQQQQTKKFVKQIQCKDDENKGSFQDLFIGTLINSHSAIEDNSEWNIEVFINKAKITLQIDTGAQANILSKETAKMLNLCKLLKSTNTNILTFSGEKLPMLGKIDLTFSYNNNFYKSKFFILDLNCKNLIGLDLAKQMKLIKNVNITTNVNMISSEKIIENYSNVFDGLGHLKTECHLELKTNVNPIVDAPRKIPFGLHDKLKDELDRMTKLNVIKPVSEPTEWVSSIVLVTKPNGQLRICLDPRNLNKSILRPHYPFPNIDDCKARLSGSKYFSSLDANSGFWMIPLDEPSSKLCTFNTPFGRYRFLRLPFGINAAPELFHSEVVKFFGDIEGLIIYIDDFLIFARSIEEHNRILEKVLQRAEQVGFKFNKDKCKFLLNEIKFIGHIFNEFGVKPDEDKIRAISEMPVPQNVTELQRFLGMINYLGNFIPNLSSKNKSLRDLLKKDIQWHWDKAQNDEFQNLKSEITKSPVLTYFDPNKDLVLSVDASKYAVGAAILHGKQPIAYASASLTSAQEKYAQIEKELFAIVFGCLRFHQYTYGKKVLVETDHKPLVSLFNKPLHKIPARLQRFMLRLQSYDLSVSYKAGKYLYIADTLSRCPLSENALEDLHDIVNLHCNFLKSHLEIPFSNINDIKEHSKTDEVFGKLKIYIKNGWPKHKKFVDQEVLPYFKIRDELHVLDDIILKNNQVLVPKSLQNTVLNKIHEGHMGVQRCQSLARQSVYWPNMYNDIFNKISSCDICLKYRNSKSRQEILTHDTYSIPWFKIGCDLFEFNKKYYLLVVDYFSKFIEIELLNSGYSGPHVILKLKSIFARHGIPTIFVSDNGPPFNSNEFREFLTTWSVEHKTSSPYLARSNGLAERSIQTIKRILHKCLESGTDPYIALLNYRTTPKGNLPSPSELLMSRRLNTKLPNYSLNLQPKLVDIEQYQKQINSKVKKSSKYFNSRTKKYEPIKSGDNVMFKRNPTSFWFPGEIVEKCPEPRSFIIKDKEGSMYRRNEEHILKKPEAPTSSKKEATPTSSDFENITKENDSDGTYVTRRGRKVVAPTRFTTTKI